MINTNNELERNPAIISTLETRAKKSKKGKAGDFIKALWEYYIHCQPKNTHGYIYFHTNTESYNNLTAAYTALSNRPIHQISTPEEFINPLTQALNDFLGPEETARIQQECVMQMEFPYAYSSYRPSYRSKNAADYKSAYGVSIFLNIILRTIDFMCYNRPLEEMLTHNRAHGLDDRAALALRQGDESMHAIITEAILGDNNNIALSRTIISAIVKSGDTQVLELLGKLLLAAKGQEGLRQSILETCDQGTLESHIYFIKLILENGLCRFSSVIRAFDTWSGLAYGDQNQKTVEKCMALALKYLENDSAIPEALNSPDTTDIYLALWAQSCRDVHSATNLAHKLLSSPEKYKRLVGWYFITHTANEDFRHSLATEYLHLRDPEELAWATANLSMNSSLSYYSNLRTAEEKEKEAREKTYPHNPYPNTAPEREVLFAKLAETAEYIGSKSREFKESVFPWCSQTLIARMPCWVMMGLAAYDRCPKLTLKIAQYLPLMESNQRPLYYTRLLNPEIPAERAILLEGMSDKSQYVRKDIVSRLSLYPLAEADITRLTKALTSQSATYRTNIMTVLKKQNENLIQPAIGSLLESRNNNQLIAGIELLDIYSTANPALKDKYASHIASLTKDENLPQDIVIQLERLQRQEEKTEASQALYNPASPDFDVEARKAMRPPVPQVKDKVLKNQIIPNEKAVIALYERMADVLIQNKDYEYETEYFNGSRHKVLLGGSHIIHPVKRAGNRNHAIPQTITDYPLAEEWIKAAGEFATNKTALLAILSLSACTITYGYSNKTPEKWYVKLFDGYPVVHSKNGLYAKISDALNKKDKNAAKSKNTGAYTTSPLNIKSVNTILEAILYAGQAPDDSALFDFAFTAYVNLVNKIPQGQLSREFEMDNENKVTYGSYSPTVPSRGVLQAEYISFWRSRCYKYAKTDAQFTALFNELWYQFVATGMHKTLGIFDERIFRAHSLGLVSEDAVNFHFTAGPDAHTGIRNMTTTGQLSADIYEKYPQAKEIIPALLDAIVTVEENRGDLPTPMTGLAANIQRFDGGAPHFANLLAALGNTGFHRGYVYSYGDRGASISKTTSLSRLLRCCRPTPTGTPETLRAALKSAKIPEKRAIQAAIYAPVWAGLLEKAMDIPGLKSGVWFFHAHVSENFSVEKETEVAIFAAIPTQDFKDGIFDRNWFFEAYNTLGEKRFNELYKNAKYITDSNSAHRRSQLYADAVLGRLNKDELKAEITDKRNQEKLRAYALIAGEANNQDVLEQYDFIQRYKKQSREYGAARQASEGRAAEIALDNLAITAGYDSTDRMIWALEGAKIDQLRPLMLPQAVGDVEVWLDISADGTPEIAITKNGKPQKTVPKSMAKDETILEIKNAVKELKGQKSRARYSFEAAMISRTTFTMGEIAGLLAHPVLGGMVSALVLMVGDTMGFPALDEGVVALIGPSDGGLCQSTTVPESKKAEPASITIAHPHDFMENGMWSKLQQYVYREKITQPFKQVFREYYPITQDEKDAANISRRYAGHQVQPKKTVSLLKTRGWTADYEEGLQRVWHKENIIVRMYALADWFSPADTEVPTLEAIQFFSRDKGEPLPFASIPPVIFSETMRDIDLVVSVAHAGGVDPEASHSTVEMRVAIARELLAMLKVENVSFKTAHAIIAGNLGEYSVHMGSGVMHKLGTGMLAVLPVHSQARGRIFLPFADEDPKTAEILAKILLFADDAKIKDPGILMQIK